MPVSKTDANAGTLKGRWRALRRGWRNRKALRNEAERIETLRRHERIREFWEHFGWG